MKMAEANVDRVRKGSTAQGFYVVGADGSFYGYNNNRSVVRVNAFMDAGLELFRSRPPKKVEVTPQELDAPSYVTPPSGTSVLRIFGRIRPLPSEASDRNRAVGRDHIWVLASELKKLEEKLDPELPRSFVLRLVRFHMVDNVRGEPHMWAPHELSRVEFSSEWIDRSKRRLRFYGAFAMSTKSGDHGMEGVMEGEFAYGPDTWRIERFRAYATATAWGSGQWAPNPPPGRFPMVFGIVDATDDLTKSVPPQAAQYGLDYLAPDR